MALEHHGDVAVLRGQRVHARRRSRSRPWLGCSSPAMQCSSVDLPQPEGSTRIRNSPGAMSVRCRAARPARRIALPRPRTAASGPGRGSGIGRHGSALAQVGSASAARTLPACRCSSASAAGAGELRRSITMASLTRWPLSAERRADGKVSAAGLHRERHGAANSIGGTPGRPHQGCRAIVQAHHHRAGEGVERDLLRRAGLQARAAADDLGAGVQRYADVGPRRPAASRSCWRRRR